MYPSGESGPPGSLTSPTHTYSHSPYKQKIISEDMPLPGHTYEASNPIQVAPTPNIMVRQKVHSPTLRVGSSGGRGFTGHSTSPEGSLVGPHSPLGGYDVDRSTYVGSSAPVRVSTFSSSVGSNSGNYHCNNPYRVGSVPQSQSGVTGTSAPTQYPHHPSSAGMGTNGGSGFTTPNPPSYNPQQQQQQHQQQQQQQRNSIHFGSNPTTGLAQAASYAPARFNAPSPNYNRTSGMQQMPCSAPNARGLAQSEPQGNTYSPHALHAGGDVEGSGVLSNNSVPLNNNSVSGRSASYYSERGNPRGYGGKTTENAAKDDISSSASASSTSSLREDLPLCPNDSNCTMINDRKHQRKFAHTCRLYPCYHGHVERHAKLFRHAPGQLSSTEGVSGKVSSQALTSVNFSSISPEAPNAYRIYVSHGDRSCEIFGDWANVRVHTLKRYLHQVFHIPPVAQALRVVQTDKQMDDELRFVKAYQVEVDNVIELKNSNSTADADQPPRIPFEDL